MFFFCLYIYIYIYIYLVGHTDWLCFIVPPLTGRLPSINGMVLLVDGTESHAGCAAEKIKYLVSLHTEKFSRLRQRIYELFCISRNKINDV